MASRDSRHRETFCTVWEAFAREAHKTARGIEKTAEINEALPKILFLSSKKKGSHNRRKARVALEKLYGKIRNQCADLHHKTSCKLVDAYGHIVAEDLNIAGMIKNHHLARLISDAGWRQFLNFLAYKAEITRPVYDPLLPGKETIKGSLHLLDWGMIRYKDDETDSSI
jgi:IS605 OrfB family transposase